MRGSAGGDERGRKGDDAAFFCCVPCRLMPDAIRHHGRLLLAVYVCLIGLCVEGDVVALRL